MHILTGQAISAALAHHWDDAVTLNQRILQENPNDYDALNRLAYALTELNRLEEAKEMFMRVLELDPKNMIATKNLIKIQKLLGAPLGGSEMAYEDTFLNELSPSLFLEEPGKTKTSHLIRLAPKEIIANLRTGFRVQLMLKNRSIAVQVTPTTCIGYLPDDIAFTLCRLMNAGSEYTAHIKSADPTFVTIFIRETKRCEAFADIPSFLDAKKLSQSIKHMQKNQKVTFVDEDRFSSVSEPPYPDDLLEEE